MSLGGGRLVNRREGAVTAVPRRYRGTQSQRGVQRIVRLAVLLAGLEDIASLAACLHFDEAVGGRRGLWRCLAAGCGGEGCRRSGTATRLSATARTSQRGSAYRHEHRVSSRAQEIIITSTGEIISRAQEIFIRSTGDYLTSIGDYLHEHGTAHWKAMCASFCNSYTIGRLG